MSTIAETQDTPKQGGFLSRLFNKFAETFNDIKNEYKSGMEKVRQETERERMHTIEAFAISEIQHGASDEDTVQAYKEFLAKDKDAHRYGKIDAAEILLMKQKIKTGEYTPVVEVKQHATLEA